MIELILDKTGMRLTTINNGKSFSRPIDTKTFKSLLEKSATFTSGMLPANTRYYRQRGAYIVLAVELPPIKRKINTGYAGSAERIYEGAALPAGVFFFKIFENKDKTFNITRAEIYATKSSGITSTETPIQHYPVPNNSTAICWGSDNAIGATLKALSAVEGVITSFFTTRFNAELGLPRLSRHFPCKFEPYGGDEGVRKYFEELTKHDKFEDSWLVSSGKRTFGSTLNRFLDADSDPSHDGDDAEDYDE